MSSADATTGPASAAHTLALPAAVGGSDTVTATAATAADVAIELELEPRDEADYETDDQSDNGTFVCVFGLCHQCVCACFPLARLVRPCALIVE
jgi:hypothetical protein